jgi:plastocyanin
MNSAFFRNATHWLRACALVTLAFCAAVVMPAMFATAAEPAPTLEVKIVKFEYAPKEITIAPGTKIVWTNGDETPHTVTSNDKSFASKGLDTDDKFEHVFSKEGDFGYICTVHPFMTGVVHVHKQ